MSWNRLDTLRNRLVLLIFAITAAAIGFVYLYVVPQLRSNLTAEKLSRLETSGLEQTGRLQALLDDPPDQARLRRAVRQISQRADGRLTLLGVRTEDSGPAPSFVVADSELERTALLPSYPAARAALSGGRVSTAVERVGGQPIGETAIVLSTGERPQWVSVFSTPLDDVDDSVGLIQRQILIAGLIALAAALAAGWFAARGHSRRLRRLEEAAQNVAEGDLQTPIPVDSRDEVGQLAATLNEMRVRLARLDSARKEFIANASHELRTPIFSLSGFMELLEDDDPDPAARAEFVRTMREQVDRLTKLTIDLLDLSKLDAEAIEIRRERVRLADVAQRVAEEFGPRADSHGSSIAIADGNGAAANADPDRVAQIMRILIDNVLTHTPPGTAITVQTKTNDAGNPSATASLTVTDDGPGIDAHSRDRVFERFYTGDEVSGSGLGLAIGRELAVRMGGSLELRTRRGQTAFELRLPALAARS